MVKNFHTEDVSYDSRSLKQILHLHLVSAGRTELVTAGECVLNVDLVLFEQWPWQIKIGPVIEDLARSELISWNQFVILDLDKFT